MENIETEYKYFISYFSNKEQNALQNLINNPDVILKPTGKGGGLVLIFQALAISPLDI